MAKVSPGMVTVPLSSETAAGSGRNRCCATARHPSQQSHRFSCAILQLLWEADASLPSDKPEMMKEMPGRHEHKWAAVSWRGTSLLLGIWSLEGDGQRRRLGQKEHRTADIPKENSRKGQVCSALTPQTYCPTAIRSIHVVGAQEAVPSKPL